MSAVAGALACLALAVGGDSSAATAAPSFTPNHLFVGGRDTSSSFPTVFEFDETGTFVRAIPAGTTADIAYGLAFGPDGALYVALLLSSKVVRIDASLATTTLLDSTDDIAQPVGVTFGAGGFVYVGNRTDGGKLVVGSGGGEVASRPGVPGIEPSFVTIGPDGHVLVSNYGTNNIFDIDENLQLTQAIGNGVFTNFPANVTFGPDGTWIVADFGASKIRRFQFRSAIADLDVAGLNGPYGTALGPDGNLYIANYNGGNVIVADPGAGTTVRTFTTPNMGAISGLAFAPFRFRASITGTQVTRLATSRLADTSAVVSVSPGSGTVMVLPGNTAIPGEFPYVGASRGLVFHGLDIHGNGTAWLFHGASISPVAEVNGTGSIEASAKGKTETTGFFTVKSLTGSIHVARSGAGALLTFTASRRVP